MKPSKVKNLPQFTDNEEVQKLTPSRHFARNLAANSSLVRTYRSSSAKTFSSFEMQNFREGMRVKLAGINPKHILNADECGIFYNAGPKSALRHPDDKYKIDEEKRRLTLFPYLSFIDELGFRPVLITNRKGRDWRSLLTRSQETVKVKIGDEERTLVRYLCTTEHGEFTMYCNPTSWMTSFIFKAELTALSSYLATTRPGVKYYLLCDNFRGHVKFDSKNLATIFLPPLTTSVLQPADVLWNAIFKAKYQKNKTKLLSDLNRDSMSLTLEEGVNLTLRTIGEIKQDVADESFRRTNLAPFQIGYTPKDAIDEISEALNDLQTKDFDIEVSKTYCKL